MNLLCRTIWPHRILRAMLALILAGLLTCAGAVYADDDAVYEDDFDAPYELVLQAARNGEVLSNTLLGMQKGFTGYYLPVKGMADLLGLNAKLDLENKKVTGWFLKPENTYEIDAANGVYTVRGEPVDLGTDHVIVQDFGGGFGDIYIPVEDMEIIWPLGLELNFLKLQLQITTKQKLPYEERRERQAMYDRLRAAQDKKLPYGIKMVENPYRMWSPPVVDVNAATHWDEVQSQWNHSLDLSGRNDLLGFSADYFMGFDYADSHLDLPDNLRMTLTRRTFGDDTMPLGFRELKLGDVGVRTPTLLVGTNSGRGVAVSSRPLRRDQSFDEITVEGNASPGWEIELYRNAELLDFGVVPSNGQYRFDDIALLAGNNEIKVVLYGPGGEKEERVQQYRIGGGLLPPGEVEYEASVVDTSHAFISFENNSSGGGTRQLPEGTAYNGTARVGINRWMSLFGTFSNAITRQGAKKYATAGSEMSLGPVQANVEAYKELGGGYALDTRAATNMMGWHVNLKTQYMHDFESDRVGYDDGARTFQNNINVSRRFETSIGRVGVNAGAEHERYVNGHTTSRYQMGNTLSLHQQTYGNRVNANYSDGHLDSVDGLSNVSFRINRKLGARGYLDYRIKPNFDFTNLAASLDYRHSAKLSAGMDVTRDLVNKTNGVGANVSYDFDKFFATLGGNWYQDGGLSVTLRASTSLGPYGENGSYIMSSDSLLSQNAVNTHAYLDRNLNDIYDFGDDPVSDAVLQLDYREGAPANEEGYASFVEGTQGDYADLTYKQNSANNPFYASRHPAYRMLLRPGVRQSLDFALVETGTVDGAVYFKNGSPVPGMRLELVDHEGHVVNQTLTSFDGYYAFEFVKPGSYIIRPDPALDVTVPVRMVSITPDELFIYGVNMNLLENAGLPPSAVKVDEHVAQQNMSPILNSLSRLQSTLRSAVNGS